MRSGRRTGWNFIRGEEPRDSRSRLCPAVQWGFRVSSSGTDGLFLLFFKKRNFWISYYIFTLVNGKREKKRLNAWSESKNKQFSLFYLIILVISLLLASLPLLLLVYFNVLEGDYVACSLTGVGGIKAEQIMGRDWSGDGDRVSLPPPELRVPPGLAQLPGRSLHSSFIHQPRLALLSLP